MRHSSLFKPTAKPLDKKLPRPKRHYHVMANSNLQISISIVLNLVEVTKMIIHNCFAQTEDVINFQLSNRMNIRTGCP